MTDRVNYLTVALEKDMRIDDAQALVQAIRCMRNVLDVKENVADPMGFVIEERVRQEMAQKLIEVVSRRS